MIFKQFYHEDHRHFNYFFVKKNGEASKYKDGPDLFGWSPEECERYTTGFNLELIYD